jgi:hypothetical protein
MIDRRHEQTWAVGPFGTPSCEEKEKRRGIGTAGNGDQKSGESGKAVEKTISFIGGDRRALSSAHAFVPG